MSQQPLVSVLMPVYNAECYVAQAIESILSQTLQNFEFIILDDGSTDGSLKILKAYAAQDKRIQLISRENRGVICTRNELLEQAQGDLIAIMDADDIALPERLALQVEFLNANPQVVCVGGAHQLIDEKGRLLTWLHLPEQNEQIQQAALAGHGSICNPCAMIRRVSLVAIGGYDETLECAEDLDVWLKLGEIGELANLKDTILKYRLLKSSISQQHGVLQRQAAKEICERAWLRRGIEGYFEAEEPWRPTEDAASQHRFMLQYGWWAFNSGQRWTASLYGVKAITALPFAVEGWKLLAYSAFKQSPTVVQKA